MFNKILIANRGEIACRVIETAHKMGVASVAVYSDADANARHVALADEAVLIGSAPVSDSYLRGDRIIAAALAVGAEAIHPGYGFLSENPDFVRDVHAAGLRFIGPSAEAIEAMGLKDAAKTLMQKAGVPVVPGYHGAKQGAEFLAEQAADIGYPVLIKAVAGGGGKGMRLVEAAGDFASQLAAAQGEAKAAFGNDAVLIEKFIPAPRHIEIQIFGDDHGNLVHLFERDCSLQRRHQKVIEEAPAPDIPAELRDAMGQAAVQAARAIGYSGAGTVEFIVDGSGPLRLDGFWFMEMNTRLQVEHPVTEMITGLDLVAWQLQIAAGEPLPLAQSDLAIDGWAFEARIYAEDVPGGFLPATGRLTHLKFPIGVRVDTGVRAGDEISPYYDPMIAKVTVHGPDRTTALARLTTALQGTQVAGSVTNIGFLAALSQQPDFVAGRVDTGLIARNLTELTTEEPTRAPVLALAALACLGLPKAAPDLAGFALWQTAAQAVAFMQGDQRINAQVLTHAPGAYKIYIDGQDFEIEHKDGWTVYGLPLPCDIISNDASVSIFTNQSHHFTRIDELERAVQDAEVGNVIKAPMPGLVKRVFVKVGAMVTRGDPLMILEAMKMEHRMLATRDGSVADIMAQEGDLVQAGAALVALEEV